VCGTRNTDLALVGNLARLERRLWFVELDALLIILSFIGGMALLYRRGVGI
jgi:cation:H+ antiporter